MIESVKRQHCCDKCQRAEHRGNFHNRLLMLTKVSEDLYILACHIRIWHAMPAAFGICYGGLLAPLLDQYEIATDFGSESSVD